VVDLEPDGVSRPQTNPLRDRSILLLSSSELLLCAEGFVALWARYQSGLLEFICWRGIKAGCVVEFA
jgi:hypothetical protein